MNLTQLDTAPRPSQVRTCSPAHFLEGRALERPYHSARARTRAAAAYPRRFGPDAVRRRRRGRTGVARRHSAFDSGSLACYRGDEELGVRNTGTTELTLLAFLAPKFANG